MSDMVKLYNQPETPLLATSVDMICLVERHSVARDSVRKDRGIRHN